MRRLARSVLQFRKTDLLDTLLQLVPIEGVGDQDQPMVVGHGDGWTLGSGQ